MNRKTLKITPELLKRLDYFATGRIQHEDEDKKSKGFYGILYGIRLDDVSMYPVVCSCSGNHVYVGEEDKETDVEFLSELLPIGLDPVGIVYLSADDGDDEQERERVSNLISQLPEALLDTHDPIIITKRGTTPINASVHSAGALVDLDVSIIDNEEISKHVTTIRLRGKLDILASATEKDMVSWLKHAIEKVSCPYGSFRLENSKVFLLHTFTPAVRKNTGWTSSEIFKEEYDEECKVTNLNPLDESGELNAKELANKYTVEDLWKLIDDKEDEDDGFGVGEVKKKKKNIKKGETMDFRLYLKMTGDACTSKTRNCAPVIHYERREEKVVKIQLNIDGLAMAPNSLKIIDLMDIMKGCIQRQVHTLGGSVMAEFKKFGTVSSPQVFHLKPEPLGHFASMIYTKAGTCNQFAPFRMKLHRKFLLPTDRPYFRRLNRFTFEADMPTKGPLTNVHVGLKPSGIGGEVSLVDGYYSYHHYLQDNVDDNGWGCAYRSLQTLISWFKHQGYAGTPVPTHDQIQKCLVDIGDKEKSFIGSKQWIGSTEVGYVLEKSCEVQSKFLSVSTGDEMASKGRELAHHFQTNGTPVMIGGGVLAHTILGVDWDEATGNIAWLILDPHFTGADWTNDKKPNLSQIQSKGWVGWKKPDFWVKDAFYNMCMPQKPDMF